MLFQKKEQTSIHDIEPVTIEYKASVDVLPVIRRFDDAHNYQGLLLVVEGIDGSGKSTQLELMQKWLEAQGHGTVLTAWNSSELVSKIIKKGKKSGQLNPTTFSLLHATDFADRLHSIIIPALKAGIIVLADRYVFTAMARDVARECSPKWVRDIYSFAIKPDAVFYFKVDVNTSLERISMTRTPKFYEAGMDMNLSADVFESYKIFQSRVIEEYNKLVNIYGFKVFDGTQQLHPQQMAFRSIVKDILEKKSNGKKQLSR